MEFKSRKIKKRYDNASNYTRRYAKFKKLQSEANSIHIFLKMLLCLNQPWAALFIYWFGFLLKDIHPDLSTNKYVHNIYITKGMLYFKYLILKYNPYKEIWKSNLKKFVILYYVKVQINLLLRLIIQMLTGKWFGNHFNPFPVRNIKQLSLGISMVLYRWENIWLYNVHTWKVYESTYIY